MLQVDFWRDRDFVDSTKRARVEIILIEAVLLSNYSNPKFLETKFRYLGLDVPSPCVFFVVS